MIQKIIIESHLPFDLCNNLFKGDTIEIAHLKKGDKILEVHNPKFDFIKQEIITSLVIERICK